MAALACTENHTRWGWIREAGHTSWKFCRCQVSHFLCQYSELQPSNTQTKKAVLQSKSLLAGAKTLPLLWEEWRCPLQIWGWHTSSLNTTGWAKEPLGCQYLKKFFRVLAGLQTSHATIGQSYVCPRLLRSYHPSKEERPLLSIHASHRLLSHLCWPELALSKNAVWGRGTAKVAGASVQMGSFIF